MRLAAVLPLLLASFVISGCFFAPQVVVGPTVDERGNVGGMVRARVTFGTTYVNLMATGEASGRQTSPHALLATGVGLASHIDLPQDYALLLNIRMVAMTAVPWQHGASAFGGAVGLVRYLKTKDELATKSEWQGWAIGGELACDRQFGLGSQDMVLSPGFIFEYVHIDAMN